MKEYRRLKAELVMKGIKHKDVADLLGIAVSTFSNKINRANGTDFKPDEIKAICKEYGIKVDIFFDNDLSI